MKRKDDTKPQETAVTNQLLSHLKFRSECPETDDLLLFASGLLPAAAAQKTEDHLSLCRFCQEEVAALTAVPLPQNAKTVTQRLADWLDGWVEAGYRLREAILQTGTAPLVPALRGDSQTQRYQVADYQILVGKTAAVGQTAVWQLSGQLWHNTVPTTDYSGELLLFLQDELRQQTNIDALGTFSIGEMEAGQYTLVFKLKSELLKIAPFSMP
ncbi:MAG: hypothetical protein R3D55_26225 [Chloroflexota bacterium]